MERLKKFLMTYLVASGRNKMCTSCLKAMPLPIRPPSSHWHSWRITLGESPVTIYIWGLRALAVNQNTEVVPGWCREQLVDAQGRSHLHFQSVLPHYLCHRATSSTVAFLCVDFFSPPTLISASNLTFCLPQMSTGKATGSPHHMRPNILMGRSSVVPKIFSTYFLLQLKGAKTGAEMFAWSIVYKRRFLQHYGSTKN